MLFRSHARDLLRIFDPGKLRKADGANIGRAIVQIARLAWSIPSKCSKIRGEGWLLWAHIHARAACAAGSSLRPAGRSAMVPRCDLVCVSILRLYAPLVGATERHLCDHHEHAGDREPRDVAHAHDAKGDVSGNESTEERAAS